MQIYMRLMRYQSLLSADFSLDARISRKLYKYIFAMTSAERLMRATSTRCGANDWKCLNIHFVFARNQYFINLS